jgi:MYXO-CTERM domain-containing protein
MRKLTPRAARIALASSLSMGLVLSAAGRAQAATRYVFATFKSDAVADEKLFTYDSTDGLNFKLISATGYSGPSPGTLRDPSIMKYADGKYYVAHTNPQGAGCCGNEDHFSIATSSDLVHWTQLTTVKGGIPKLAHVWAPEWFVEGSTVNVIANMDTGAGDFQQYLFTARDASLTSWSGPVLMGIAKNHIDTFVLKVGTTYHAFVKSESTRFLEHATAASLTGPWTLIGQGDWAGWGSGMEGPTIVKLDNGTWRMFLDPQQSTFFYTDSTDLVKWSKAVPLPGIAAVARHGTVIRDEPVGGGTGGAAGAGGAGGTVAGASGAGETSGAGGGGASGAPASAGSAGTSGSVAVGGDASGGLTGLAGAPNSGGGLAAGGSPPAAGTGGVEQLGPVSSTENAGCSCRSSAVAPGLNPTWFGALLAGLLVRARRRRTSAESKPLTNL